MKKKQEEKKSYDGQEEFKGILQTCGEISTDWKGKDKKLNWKDRKEKD